MTTTSTRSRPATRTPEYGRAGLPARQGTWTRLGNAMGYTHTEAMRGKIRAGLETLVWRDPVELAEVLAAAPARQVVASLFYGRLWALCRAGVVELPVEAAGRCRRVIGLESVTGERYVLLDVGYEVIHLYTDRPVGEQVVTPR